MVLSKQQKAKVSHHRLGIEDKKMEEQQSAALLVIILFSMLFISIVIFGICSVFPEQEKCLTNVKEVVSHLDEESDLCP